MSTGRKPFVRIPLDTGHVYCGAYHCPGDCGLPHNQKERAEYVRHALAVFDALGAGKRRERKDVAQSVRQRAKDSL